MQEFIKHPCVVPGCKCRIHEILPALEIMLATRQDDMRNKQTKLGKEYDAPDEERRTWLPRDGEAADGGVTRSGERQSEVIERLRISGGFQSVAPTARGTATIETP